MILADRMKIHLEVLLAVLSAVLQILGHKFQEILIFLEMLLVMVLTICQLSKFTFIQYDSGCDCWCDETSGCVGGCNTHAPSR